MLLVATLAAGFALAPLLPALRRASPRAAAAVAPLAPAVMFALLLWQAPAVLRGEPLAAAVPWLPQLGVSFALRLDGLALVMALLVTGIGALVLAYAGAYLAGHPLLGRLEGVLLLFLASMLGLVLADDLVSLFVFWELTSVSSYVLIGFDHERVQARAAALRALLVTALGGLALLAGLLLLSIATGASRLSELPAPLGADPRLAGAAVALVLTGAFTKSAQVPFHGWLPGAMEAPTPVSAYLHAATMVKAGVYLVARLSPSLWDAPGWRPALLAAGGATMLLGSFRALRARDLKQILAHSTLGSLGTLVFLLGLGTEAAALAAVAYLIAHALFKGALFLVAGAIDHETGTRDVSRLGRLARALPGTTAAGMLAALSMAGLPAFFGFVAKELVYGTTLAVGAAETAVVLAANAAIAAAGAVVGIRPFLGRAASPHPVPPPAHRAPVALFAPPLVLSALGVLLGLAPHALGGVLAAAASGVRGHPVEARLAAFHLGPELGLSAATLGAAALLYAHASRRLARPAPPAPERTPFSLALGALSTVARGQTRLLQNGSLPHYLAITFAVAVAAVGAGLLSGGPQLPRPSLEGALFHEVAVAAVILVSAALTVRSRSRLGAIAAMGAAGYGVGLLFVFFGAPDLAMTQFVIETLTVILFVLAFYRLPAFARLSSPRRRVRDAAVAIAVGATMGALVLGASSLKQPHHVARYYLDESVPSAHGHNVVNVVLVDFRALDTLGEITVLAVAGFGVVSLLRLRPRGGRR